MSDSAPPTARGAVFVSYAREDTEAARRIAEALRSHGVEVWFDQNELRGGDAWDGKIRKQINDCALFLPVVSQRTQERNKGYFRLEWKLAVEQMHLMLEGVPYLAPVVIDDTPESGAAVPPEFMKVQWTRLSGGLPTTPFVEQIKRLLEAPRKAATGPRTSATPSASPVASPKSTAPLMVVGLVAVIAIAAALYFALRPAAKDPTSTAKPVAVTPAVAPVSAAPAFVAAVQPALANDKSIAVLPFTNMSDDKESGFFTDGMHEDILTNLALIRELHVVSRTSVMQYRDTKKTLREIGRELGVAYLLEGSVRRVGHKVRVTGQLIRAATDEHVWAKNYDRDLTDIFAIQSELSQAIASELKLALSPQEQKLLNRRPTENIAAYDLFLKARELRNAGSRSTDSFRQQEGWLSQATQLDSKFAGAWAALAWSHSYQYSFGLDRSDGRMALAKAAMDHAVQLAAEAPDVMIERGYYYYYCFRDYGRAAEIFRSLLQVQPNEAALHNALASIYRRQGNWLEALQSFRRASQLDPLSRDYILQVQDVAFYGRRYDEAMAEQKVLITLGSSGLRDRWNFAMIPFFSRGSTREMEIFSAELDSVPSESSNALDMRKSWAVTRGDHAEALRLDKLQPYSGSGSFFDPKWHARALDIAVTLAAQGKRDAARTRLAGVEGEIRTRLEREPTNASLWSRLGEIESVMGNTEPALTHVRKAMELEPESIDAAIGPSYRVALAFVYAWTGDKDQAIAEYARLLKTTSAPVNVHEMRKNPAYFPLQGDPRFEALLNDPKNNAPLF